MAECRYYVVKLVAILSSQIPGYPWIRVSVSEKMTGTRYPYLLPVLCLMAKWGDIGLDEFIKRHYAAAIASGLKKARNSKNGTPEERAAKMPRLN